MTRRAGWLRNAPPGTRGYRYDGCVWCPTCLARHLHVRTYRLPDRDMQRPVSAGVCDRCGHRLDEPRWRTLLRLGR